MGKKKHERALAENERAGEKRSAAIVRLGLARLALEEGKTQEAEAAAVQRAVNSDGRVSAF